MAGDCSERGDVEGGGVEEVGKLRGGGETRKTRRTRDGLTNSHKHTLQGCIALVAMRGNVAFPSHNGRWLCM
jgi:hypothetical protein